MGGSGSKPTEKPPTETNNNGMLNGNLINNGNIIETIEQDISNENLLLKIVILLKTIHILIVLIKLAIKYVKKSESQKRQIEEINLKQNRS